MSDVDAQAITSGAYADTYILDALEVSLNISKINFKVNYPFKVMTHRATF